MLPLINARYRIIKTLGENDKGSIFLVEDTLYDNSLAALKTFHAGSTDDVFLNNLRIEFSTLSKFKHPNIAQVYDIGIIRSTDVEGFEGSLFFTLEYCEGTDLLAATASADGESICGLVFQIVHALDYIHQHGLIHFDIKPANILVSDAGPGSGGKLVKLIDFGFSTTRGESHARPIRGTLEYMAPEVLRGDPHDHRVDLYSLGVTLFEVIARHTPFRGDTATETIKQHLSSPVPRLIGAGREIPDLLTELTMSLLQKNPDDRPASAAEILQFLHARHPEEFFLQNVLEHVPPHHLIGRAPETDHLYVVLRDDLAKTTAQPCEHPAVTVITGESGIGKTAMLHEIKLRAETEGLLFFNSLCFARSVRQYEPFLNLLLDQVAHLRSFGRKGEQFLETHAEFLKRAFENDSDPITNNRAQHIVDPERRLHFIDLWSQFFFDIASLSPYGVWIDNIEDADESTLELLVYLLRNAHRHRVKFFISGIEGNKIARLVQSLDAADVVSLALPPLHAGAVRELMAVVLDAPDVDMRLADMITSKFGGSPSVLLEFVSQYRTLPRRDRLPAIDRDLQLPQGQGQFSDAILLMYRQRVSQCKPEELFLLRALSCFDAPVSLHLLQQIAPFNAVRAKYFLDLLMNVGILRSIEKGNRWFFSQSRFKDFIYDSLGEEKAMLHTLIADTMAAGFGTRSEFAEVIAHHYKNAGSTRSAYPFFVAAAEQKRTQYALHESLLLLNEACSLVPHEEIDIAVFENLAECYSLAGEYPQAILLYEQLRIDAVEETKRYTYAKELGSIYNREGRLDEAYSLLLEAAEIARTPGEIIEVEEELSIIDISRGKYAEAFERSNRVLDAHGTAADSPAITGILNNLGIIHFYQNDPDAAAVYFRRSIAILQNANEKSKLISPYLNLGNVCSVQENFSEAARHWQHALALTQEVGNVQLEARAYNNIGIASFHQGNNDDASVHYEKAYEIFSRLGSIPGMALCLTNIGEVHLANAKYQQALECWERDLKLYESLHDEHGMIEIELLLAGVHMVFGHTDAAHALVSAAEPLLAGSSNPAQQALLHLTQGSLCEAEGDHAAARIHCEEAVSMYRTANDHRGSCLALLKAAEVERSLGNRARAAVLLADVRERAAERQYAVLHGEAMLQLGILSGMDRDSGLEPAITYLTGAFGAVQDQIVTETTWNVCNRLGSEYMRRGMHEKGAVYFRYGVRAIEYLASEITSDTLRAEYFNSLGRKEALGEMQTAIASER